MTRRGLDQRKVVDELAIDKAHYHHGPDCKTLVCFVYDPNTGLDNPDALEEDLSGEEFGTVEHGSSSRLGRAERAGGRQAPCLRYGFG